MQTLNCKCLIASLRTVFIFFIAILFSFTSDAQISGQLPVNLKIFKARAEGNNKVKVFWTTEYEKDNAYFDIERSADGINFTSVGKVPGVNYHGHLTNYTFYDPHPLKAISYYRLKQVDVDGKFNYSPIERVKISDTDNSFDVFPNPGTGGLFKVDVLKNVTGNIDVRVFDVAGNLRLQELYAGNALIIVKHHLPAGIYTIKVTGKDFYAAKKLVLQ